jgi:hypothetical protein
MNSDNIEPKKVVVEKQKTFVEKLPKSIQEMCRNLVYMCSVIISIYFLLISTIKYIQSSTNYVLLGYFNGLAFDIFIWITFAVTFMRYHFGWKFLIYVALLSIPSSIILTLEEMIQYGQPMLNNTIYNSAWQGYVLLSLMVMVLILYYFRPKFRIPTIYQIITFIAFNAIFVVFLHVPTVQPYPTYLLHKTEYYIIMESIWQFVFILCFCRVIKSERKPKTIQETLKVAEQEYIESGDYKKDQVK